MEIKNFSEPSSLEKYSFMWSEVRLVLAFVALIVGGTPFLRLILPIPALYGLTNSLLTIAWIVSGAASAYLLYRYAKSDKKLFGAEDMKDRIAFFISVVSGINLGLTGLLGNNIGMSIFSAYFFLLIAALAYLWSAYRLYTRWNASGKRIFSTATPIVPAPQQTV
jgi:hypothetical protein